MLRPKDITDQLGISAPTLRVWSNTFAAMLSPAAQPSKTESGGAAQRRYTEQDLAYFRKAKEFLASGSTFEQALEQLQALDPSEFSPFPLEAGKPNETTTDSAPASETTPAVIEQTHPIIQAFEEALRAKDETIRSLESRVAEVAAAKDQVIAGKEETIAVLEARVLELSHAAEGEVAALKGQIVLLEKEATPAAATAPKPAFRWAWLNKLLTVEQSDVG